MSGINMANWLTRGINRLNTGVRKGLQRAFGGEQPAPTPPGIDRRFPPPPPRPPPPPPEEPEEPFGFPPEEPIEDGGYEEPPEYVPPIGGEPWGEPVYTLYGDGVHTGESWSMTGPEWIGEAYLSDDELMELYGLDNLDIIEGLMDLGYDYDYVSDDTGELISGLWHDWRELYGEAA